MLLQSAESKQRGEYGYGNSRVRRERQLASPSGSSVSNMTDDHPHAPRTKNRSASICASSMEAIPPSGSTPDQGTPVGRRRRPAARSQSARIASGRSIRRRAAALANANQELKNSHYNSEPKLTEGGDGTPEVSPHIRRKGSQRRGNSVYHRKSTAFLDVPEKKTSATSGEEDEDSYRLRSFSFTSKGKVSKIVCLRDSKKLFIAYQETDYSFLIFFRNYTNYN